MQVTVQHTGYGSRGARPDGGEGSPLARIQSALLRHRRVLSHSPSAGRGTARTSVRLVDGLACAIREGDWAFTADLSPKMGGAGSGPNPGVLGRGALGACLAMSYVMAASLAGVRITTLSIDIEADYDTRGMLGFEGVSPAYGEIRCEVSIETDATESELQSVIDEAEAASSYLEVFRRPQRVVRRLRVKRAKEE